MCCLLRCHHFLPISLSKSMKEIFAIFQFQAGGAERVIALEKNKIKRKQYKSPLILCKGGH